MIDEKTNCCNTDNSDCSTQEVNCCSIEKKPSNNKKKIGLGVLGLAIVFALVSAFTTGNPSEKSNCGPGETSCDTSCETVSTEGSCCSK